MLTNTRPPIPQEKIETNRRAMVDWKYQQRTERRARKAGIPPNANGSASDPEPATQPLPPSAPKPLEPSTARVAAVPSKVTPPKPVANSVPKQPTPFQTADSLQAQNIRPPDYILPPLIPRGRIVLCVADSTTGKTPFGYQLARDVVGQRSFLDFFPHCGKPCRVALIDAESPKDDMALRLKRLSGVRSLRNGNNLILVGAEEANRRGFSLVPGYGLGLEAIAKFVRDCRIDLLILDNLWALSGGRDILKAHVLQPMLRGLREITTLPHKPTVWLFHHFRKGPKDGARSSILQFDFAQWLEEASGSRILVNLTDVRCGLERIEKRGEEYTVFKGRSRVPGDAQDIGPLYLLIDEEHDYAQIDRRPGILAEFGEKTRILLERLRGQSTFSTKDAYAATKGEMTKRTARRAIGEARAHGLLKAKEPDVFEWIQSPRDSEAGDLLEVGQGGCMGGNQYV